MTCSLPSWVCGISLGLLFGLSGCWNSTPPRVVPERPDSSAAATAMKMYDTSGDGFLDADELAKAPGLKSALERIDTTRRGKISQDEIAARIKLWADSQIGRAPALCHVTHNGKPLKQAKVVFVPEKFLGGNLPTGSGTTADSGGASISAPYPGDPGVRGLPPGFYRVEITKDGENIPAKYNTETTLGAEVYGGGDMKNSLDFDLRY